MALTGSLGSTAMNNRYPNVEGLTAETTKQTEDPILREEGL